MKIIYKRYFVILLFILLTALISGCPDRNQSGDIGGQNILTDDEHKVFEQINEYRLSKGLGELIVDERIVKQARSHSKEMADGKVPLGHSGFEGRVSATNINPQGAGENVADMKGYKDPVTVTVQGWIKSEEHRRNIEGNFNITGIGVVKNQEDVYYFTQIFMLAQQNQAQSKGGWDLSWLQF